MSLCVPGKPFAPGKCGFADVGNGSASEKCRIAHVGSLLHSGNTGLHMWEALCAREMQFCKMQKRISSLQNGISPLQFCISPLQLCISSTQCPSHNCKSVFPHRNSVFPGCNCAFPPRKGLPPATGVHFHHTRPFPPLHRRAFPCHNLPFPAQRNLFLDCARPFTEGMDSFLRQRDAFRIYVEVLDRSGHASAQR